MIKFQLNEKHSYHSNRKQKESQRQSEHIQIVDNLLWAFGLSEPSESIDQNEKRGDQGRWE